MHSSAFPAQLELTCSPRGCHLESGKPIYFPPQTRLVVLVRCRKPINHQRSLRVSISQEACHLPGLDPHESCQQPAGRGAGGRGEPGADLAEWPRGHLAGAGGGAANVRSSEAPEIYTHTLPSARASFRFEVPRLRVGGGKARPPASQVLLFTSRPHCSYFAGEWKLERTFWATSPPHKGRP